MNVLSDEEIERRCEEVLKDKSFGKARQIIDWGFENGEKFCRMENNYYPRKKPVNAKKVASVLSRSEKFVKMRNSSDSMTWGLFEEWGDKFGDNNGGGSNGR